MILRRKPTDLADAANKLPDFQSLGSGQRAIIQALLDGNDVLLVQPADSGKAAVWEIGGALMEGSTVVVSPLIASQALAAASQDQANSLETNGSEVASEADAAFPEDDRKEVLAGLEKSKARYLFLTPEQLLPDQTIAQLRNANVSLIVIDEAHCISQWGNDLRPEYLGLAHVIEVLGHPPVLAVTETASREAREEIVSRLGMKSPRIVVDGFNRPNISLRVDLFSSKDEKYRALLRRVEFADKPGIIYAATHKNAESIAADLQRIDVPAVFYHGGLKMREREEIRNRFMNGEVPVIVATNAFAVDKPDIRFVYHADVSDSVDAYYQEIGRAGRDGDSAEAVLFYRPQDISAQSFKTGSAHVDAEALEAVYHALVEEKEPMTREKLSRASEVSARKLAGLIPKLEETGAVAILDDGQLEARSNRPLTEVIEEAERRQQFQKDLRKRRLQQMQQYAEARSCRRACLLRYFGDESAEPCGNCDRCEERGVLAKVA